MFELCIKIVAWSYAKHSYWEFEIVFNFGRTRVDFQFTWLNVRCSSEKMAVHRNACCVRNTCSYVSKSWSSRVLITFKSQARASSFSWASLSSAVHHWPALTFNPHLDWSRLGSGERFLLLLQGEVSLSARYRFLKTVWVSAHFGTADCNICPVHGFT